MTGLQVVAGGFAPVKGTRHLALDHLELDEHGPVGDRAYCLVDVEAGTVLRTVQNPRLVGVRAVVQDSVLTVAMPTGFIVAGEAVATGEELDLDYWGRTARVRLLGGPHAAVLSSHLGRPVRLAASPRGAVVYGDPVTLVNRASLDELAERAGLPSVDAARFRATFVVTGDGVRAFDEDSWTGQTLVLDGATLRVTDPVPRCGVIDLDPVNGARDTALLKTLAAFRPRNDAGEPCFGVGAVVVEPGGVSVGAAGRTERAAAVRTDDE